LLEPRNPILNDLAWAVEEIERLRTARDEAVAHAQSVNADMDKAEDVLLATGHDGMSLAEIAAKVAAELETLRTALKQISERGSE